MPKDSRGPIEGLETVGERNDLLSDPNPVDTTVKPRLESEASEEEMKEFREFKARQAAENQGRFPNKEPKFETAPMPDKPVLRHGQSPGEPFAP